MYLASTAKSEEQQDLTPLVFLSGAKSTRENFHGTCMNAEPGSSEGTENDNSSLVLLQLMEEMERTKLVDDQILSSYQIVSRNSQRRLSKHKRRSNARTDLVPHKYTDDPLIAWEMLKNNHPVKAVRQMKLNTPVRQDAVRFVCMACLHQSFPDPESIPPGDILIIAGDFTLCGRPDEIEVFSKYLRHLPHTFKVVIAGNQECTFDDRFIKATGSKLGEKKLAVKQTLSNHFSLQEMKNAKTKLENVIYLEDSSSELFGIKIYGTPWLPKYDDMAFNLPRGQPLLDKWNNIPSGVDVLVTHTPPLGHGDILPSDLHFGCVELLNSVVKRIRPKYHVFGHIHSGYGCTTDGYTKFINCSMVDDRLQLANNPIIFDISIDMNKKERWMDKYRRTGYIYHDKNTL